MFYIFSIITGYGLAATIALLFAASYRFHRATNRMSARVAAVAFGLAFLCQIGQVLAYRIYPLVWDKHIGFLPNDTRANLLESFVLISIISLFIGAASILILAYRQRS